MSIPMKLEKAKLVKLKPSGGGPLDDVASMGASLAASAAGVGGMLPLVWTDTEVNFRFNPTQLQLSKDANYQGSNTRASKSGGQEQYSGTGTRTLQFSVLLDEWEAPAGADVGSMVNTLQNWCNPAPEPAPQDKPEPPGAMFVWGKFRFTGHLKSVNATFNLFRRDGSPARAEIQVSMLERPELVLPPNPTSGGPPGRRSRRVVEGDTLPSIAYRELGDPNLWRVLAAMNGIDDPTSVGPGTQLLIPTRSDAKAALR